MDTTTSSDGYLGMEEALEQLETVLNSFGGSMKNGIKKYLDTVVNKEEQWAKSVEYWWKATSPYETTNLRQAISTDKSNMPLQIKVGVDVDKLLARAGQKVKGVRTGKTTVISDYDYTEEADKYNVSAAYSPYGGREHIPFISEVWFAYAQKAYEEIFQ